MGDSGTMRHAKFVSQASALSTTGTCLASRGRLTVCRSGQDLTSDSKPRRVAYLVGNGEDGGSCSIKSIDMEFHGFSGIGSCFRRP